MQAKINHCKTENARGQWLVGVAVMQPKLWPNASLEV